MKFQCDSRKAKLNSAKHDVSFEEATTAFRDPLSLTAADPDHSVDERRFITYGLSSKGRLLPDFAYREGRAYKNHQC